MSIIFIIAVRKEKKNCEKVKFNLLVKLYIAPTLMCLVVVCTVVFRNSLKIVTLSETSAHVVCPMNCCLATQTCQNKIQT